MIEKKLANKKSERMLRFEGSPELLRDKMAPFLNFHSYSAAPRLFDDLDG
jgi:hypothetical protein